LEAELVENPTPGASPGHSAYKIRLKISSKGKGKSGGAKVISLVETTVIGQVQTTDKDTTVNLITIYDKADTASISDKELKELIKVFYQGK
jgi:hypothetical protein